MTEHPLQVWLRERSLTQRDGSNLLGITETWVNQIVNGRERASRDLLNKFREICGILADDVINWEAENKLGVEQCSTEPCAPEP